MFFPNAEVTINPALLVLLGLVVGTLGGFFGVGGGFLITGGLLIFGVPPLFAVGTGLTLVMGSSIINTLKHRRLGHVDYKLGLLMVCGTIPGVLLAERLNVTLDAAGIAGPVIRYVYIVFLSLLGTFIIFDYVKSRRRAALSVDPGTATDTLTTAGLTGKVRSLRIPPHSIRIPGLGSCPTYVSLPVSGIERISVYLPITVGLGVGFLAGLLGAGGGFILMPILVFVLGVPTTVAIGTDLFQIIITGSVGTFRYALGNHVDPLMAIIMLAAASAGSQLGATATRYVDPGRIRVLFGITILSGSLAVALKQASESNPELEYLGAVGSVVLLGVATFMCGVIAVLLIRAKREGAPSR